MPNNVSQDPPTKNLEQRDALTTFHHSQNSWKLKKKIKETVKRNICIKNKMFKIYSARTNAQMFAHNCRAFFIYTPN